MRVAAAAANIAVTTTEFRTPTAADADSGINRISSTTRAAAARPISAPPDRDVEHLDLSDLVRRV
jgi:hypothetical protein